MPLSISSAHPSDGYISGEFDKAQTKLPSAPDSEEGVVQVEGSVDTVAPQQQKNRFEWNVERLFVHNPEHSKTRTWAVRVVALIAFVPTLLLDLGRRLAFSVGLVDGKSFSLIDKASGASKAMADKVNAYMTPKELTREEKNELSKTKFAMHAKEIVKGYSKVDKAQTFSSDDAKKGLNLIQKNRGALVCEVNDFVARNADSTADFGAQINLARSLVREAINDAARDRFFIPNKVELYGMPEKLRHVEFREFDFLLAHTSRGAFAEKFVAVAKAEPDFSAGLMRGVLTKILTFDQAQEALETQVQSVYMQGLESGVKVAEDGINDLLDDAMRQGLVSRNEAVSMSRSFQPDVAVLAQAAARDIARNNTPESEVAIQLIKIAEDLIVSSKLKEEDVSYFLTSAESQISEMREALAVEVLRIRQEAAALESERAILMQKAQDQQALYADFDGMLSLISDRQSGLSSQFANFGNIEKSLRQLSQQFEVIREMQVTIRGEKISVLKAADEYYAALSQISRSSKTAAQRQNEMDALAAEGFTKTTIDHIIELKALEPKLTELIHSQAALAHEIEVQHDDIARLRSVYNVYRKNYFKALQTENRKAVVDVEVNVNKKQKTLDREHAKLVGKTGIIARMRLSEPSVPVNIDVEGNRAEVEELVRQFKTPVQIEGEGEIDAGMELEGVQAAPRNRLERFYDWLI